METKVCKVCGVEKPLSEYYFRNDSKKYRNDCKECHLNNKKIYNQENSEHRKEYMNEYRINNPTKHSDWRSENIDRVLDGVRNWKKKNPEKNKVHKHKSEKKRLNSDPKYRLKSNIRKLVRLTFIKKKYKKHKHTFDILGIDHMGFITHIESQFTDGINWGNKNEWEIDHIIPISIAKNEEQIIKLNHYSNLRPLWRKENMEKSNKILEEHKGLLYKLLGDDFVL